MIVNDGEEWEVDDILDSRLYGRGKRLQYRVKWKGYDTDLEWYNADRGNSIIARIWWTISTDATQPSLELEKAESELSDKPAQISFWGLAPWRVNRRPGLQLAPARRRRGHKKRGPRGHQDHLQRYRKS